MTDVQKILIRMLAIPDPDLWEAVAQAMAEVVVIYTERGAAAPPSAVIAFDEADDLKSRSPDLWSGTCL